MFGDDRVIVQLPGASGSITTVGVQPRPPPPPPLRELWPAQGYEDFTVDAQSDTSLRNPHQVSINVNRQNALRSALDSGIGAVYVL